MSISQKNKSTKREDEPQSIPYLFVAPNTRTPSIVNSDISCSMKDHHPLFAKYVHRDVLKK